MQGSHMDILILLVLLLTFTVIPIKVGANILKIDDASLGSCFFAVILSVIANAITVGFIGEGFFPGFVAVILTAFFFAWNFNINTVTGFVLATISMGVQLAIIFVVTGLDVALFS